MFWILLHETIGASNLDSAVVATTVVYQAAGTIFFIFFYESELSTNTYNHTSCTLYLNLSLCQIPALSDFSQDDLDEPVAVTPNSEATSPAGEDFTVTIDPSPHSLDQQQDADSPKVLSRENELLSQGSSGNICCILLVAVAILLVNWM